MGLIRAPQRRRFEGLERCDAMHRSQPRGCTISWPSGRRKLGQGSLQVGRPRLSMTTRTSRLAGRHSLSTTSRAHGRSRVRGPRPRQEAPGLSHDSRRRAQPGRSVPLVPARPGMGADTRKNVGPLACQGEAAGQHASRDRGWVKGAGRDGHRGAQVVSRDRPRGLVVRGRGFHVEASGVCGTRPFKSVDTSRTKRSRKAT